MGVILEIPTTALAVKVTNVSSPSCMKIHREDDYIERLNDVNNKLRSVMTNRRSKKSRVQPRPQIGDMVIMHNRLDSEVVTPAWWVRGVLGHLNAKTMEYNIFLVDHGYTITASREDFTIIPESSIAEDYLTTTVGIYNLIPSSRETQKTNAEIDMKVGTEWSELAVRVTRQLVSASVKTYFDYLAVDGEGKFYGELYFVLDEDIVSLSEILIFYREAIFLSEDWLSLINGSDNDAQNAIQSIDGGVIADVVDSIFSAPRKHRISTEDEKEGNGKGTNKCISSVGEKKKLHFSGQEYQRVLIHSNYHCDPLVNIEDAGFPAIFHAVLKEYEIIALRKIQAYMWPAVSKGFNVVGIGSPKCGKTFGYLLPTISSIATWETVPQGNNPAILILCSSTTDVLGISAICKELLATYTDIRCVAGWNGRPDKSLVADIYNGCQILVATPAFLARFIDQDEGHRKLINFDELSYLVIDGLDIVLNKYYEPLKQLFGKHVKIGNKEGQKFGKQAVQMVAVARHWTSLVGSFAKECMIDPYICISSYMEAAIFGRVMPQLLLVSNIKKTEKVTKLLSDNVTTMKTMIICGNSDEAGQLNEYLSKTRKTLLACEQMTIIEIRGVRECWNAGVSGMYPIIICTDEVLGILNITDVEWLVHFSLMLPSKTPFYFRFSTLMDHLKKRERKPKVTIVVDETNDMQLYGVVSVAKNCGTTIPSKFMDNVMRIAAHLDREKKMYPICDAVKAFGCCTKKYSCSYRHCVVAEVDEPTTPIKIGDKVKLNVTYVHNATHFTARIMEYTNPDKITTRYSAEEYIKISSVIQTYYADKRNRRCHRKTKVGDICAVEKTLDNFQRVKVLNIVEKDYEGVPIAAELKCIDTGAILPKISVTRLLEIPKNLAEFNTHIVEVFLAGLVPYDDEYEWNSRAFDDAHNWFPDKTKQNSFVLGTVRLHLADTIWVDPLEIHTSIIGHPDLISSSFKRHMLNLKHGEPNKNHLTKLFELCRIGGMRNIEREESVSAMFNISENETDSH